eukprot:scaffold281623_cov21-Tisochrysis_lutea.AAC.1
MVADFYTLRPQYLEELTPQDGCDCFILCPLYVAASACYGALRLLEARNSFGAVLVRSLQSF